MSSAPEQLARLLDMIPYAVSRRRVSVAELAAQFGVSAEQVRRDLAVAWVCGLPGQGGGTLIEVTWTGEDVELRNADELARPFTFTPEEALALTVALRGLADLRAVEGDTADAAERALAALEDALAAGDHPSAAPAVAVAADGPPPALGAVRDVLARCRRLALTYYSPYSDAVTERTVDPVRLVVRGGVPYLQAWDGAAEGMRTFRVDRVVAATVLDEPAQVPADAHAAEVAYTPAPDDPWLRLRLWPGARWVLDRYVCSEVAEQADGSVVVVIHGSDAGWLRRLALQLGSDAQVLAPDAAAREVRDLAREALRRYGDVTGS